MKLKPNSTVLALALLVAAPAWSQADDGMSMAKPHQGHGSMTMPTAESPQQTDSMAGMDHGSMTDAQGGTPPPDARDPHAYSGGHTLDSGAYALAGGRQLKLADEHRFGALQMNRFERVHSQSGNSLAYDAQAWVGQDYNRFVIKAEGELVDGQVEESRTELLWGHAFSPFWDAQLGVRWDIGDAPQRRWLAVGVQGLAPYWLEVDAAFYLGEGGRTALRVGGEYEILLSQKVVLQPRVEFNIHGKADAEHAIGSGLSSATAGLRLRYEINRQFAPYIGVDWKGKFGATADMARAAGKRVKETQWVAGARFWF